VIENRLLINHKVRVVASKAIKPPTQRNREGEDTSPETLAEIVSKLVLEKLGGATTHPQGGVVASLGSSKNQRSTALFRRYRPKTLPNPGIKKKKEKRRKKKERKDSVRRAQPEPAKGKDHEPGTPQAAKSKAQESLPPPSPNPSTSSLRSFNLDPRS